MIFSIPIDSAENLATFPVCFIDIFGSKIIDRYMSFFSLHHSLMVLMHCCRCKFCFNPLYIFQFFLCFVLEYLTRLVLYSFIQCMRRIFHQISILISPFIEFTGFRIHADAFFDMVLYYSKVLQVKMKSC
jgi:hypothetical protein